VHATRRRGAGVDVRCADERDDFWYPPVVLLADGHYLRFDQPSSSAKRAYSRKEVGGEERGSSPP